MPDVSLLALTGLILGLLFGAVVQKTHFCTMGALSDLVLFGSLRRLRVWFLAIAAALAGTQAMALAGLVPLDSSPYLAPRLFPLGALLGGLLFGYGMVMAGGCAARALVRVGGGSLKALLVLLLMAITVLLVTTGPLAFVMRGLEAVGSFELPLATQGLDAVLAALGLPPALARIMAGLLVLAPLLLFCLSDARFRGSAVDLGTGLVLGAIVAGGWAVTALLAPAAPESLNFVQPAGGLLIWLTAGSGQVPAFTVAAVGGVILGAALVAARTGQLRLEVFAGRDDAVRHCAGGVLMGLGGALALGCSVGQGITGLSALSLHALLALPAILAGGYLGVKALETGRLLPWPRAEAAAGSGS